MSQISKQSRTIPIHGHADYGEGKDADRYFHCWNCGFICDVDRDALGGPADRANITTEAYTQKDQYGETAYHCQGAAGATQTICEAAGGTWSSTRYIPVVSSGCPMCGTLNWRGDY